MAIVIHFPITATKVVSASKACSGSPPVNSWQTGTNRLDWTTPPDSILGITFGTSNYRALFVQRSKVDNSTPNPSQFYATTNKGPPVDSLWETRFSFSVFALEGGPPWPVTYQEDVPHSTFYYYRIIMIGAVDNAHSTGHELDSNVVTIVQPFDLSICPTPGTPDPCTIPQGCQTLVWDAPQLFVPFITGSHVPDCGSGAPGCYKIHVNWVDTPTPLSYYIYKSNVGPNNLGLVANTLTSPLNGSNDWYDSDLSDRTMWYQFVARRPNGSLIPSNIVQISY